MADHNTTTVHNAVVEIVQGDLLDATETYIIHQCNAVTDKPKGLSRAVFSRFPHADIYTSRGGRGFKDLPGTIVVKGTLDLKPSDPAYQRPVVNLIGQRYPGAAGRYANDTNELRRRWFAQCLEDLVADGHLAKGDSVAMPYNIGCGLAGGKWEEYSRIIETWAKKHSDIRVRLYKIADGDSDKRILE